MLQVCMTLETTFVEAQAWLQNTKQVQASQMAERLSIWFWWHRQGLLGEDLCLGTVGIL